MAKRKTRLKKSVKFFMFLLIIGILIVSALIYYKNSDNKNVNIKEKNPIKKIFKEKEVWPKKTTISLVATGDGLIHNAVYFDAYDKATDTFDFS